MVEMAAKSAFLEIIGNKSEYDPFIEPQSLE